MATKVKDINSMLDLICKEADGIGPQPADQILNAASTTSVEPRELNFRLTHPFVDDSQVVGRDCDVSTVIDMLIGSYDSGNDLSVIAIVGMGGMKNFGDQRMWTCVSDDFIVERLLNEPLLIRRLYQSQIIAHAFTLYVLLHHFLLVVAIVYSILIFFVLIKQNEYLSVTNRKTLH
ncbi:hypothetical protein CsSME_00034612 [Camellia sinensis var. sinensis]